MKENVKREYADHIKRLYELEEDPFYPFENEDEFPRDEVKERIVSSRKTLQEIEEKLNDTPPEIINSLQENFVAASLEIEKSLGGNTVGHPVSKSQGLIIAGAIYSKIIQILRNAMKYYGMYEIPSFYYSTDKKDQLDSKELIRLLKDRRTEITTKNYDSFHELRDDTNNILLEIRTLWQLDTGIGTRLA